jgi:probable HAF family extracellular repeat protein
LLFGGIGLLSGEAAFAQPYTVTDLGTLGGTSNILATAINAAGEIAGMSPTQGASLETENGFLWSQGTMSDLGVLPGLFLGIPRSTLRRWLVSSFSEGMTDVHGQAHNRARLSFHIN